MNDEGAGRHSPPLNERRKRDTTAPQKAHQLDVLCWLKGTADLVDAIRDGAMMRSESVLALIAAEPSPDLAKALAMGLAAQKLAAPADIDAAFHAWADLAEA
jgi:hypothetical protein